MTDTMRLPLVLLCLAVACRARPVAPEGADPSPFAVFDGTYELEDGRTLVVRAGGEGLVLSSRALDLFAFSELRADARVRAVERRSRELALALAAGDRRAVETLVGPGAVDGVPRFLELWDELALGEELRGVEALGTGYRDEDAERGFSDDGWGWETFLRASFGGRERTLRFVWDGRSGELVHAGLDKELPRAGELAFAPRRPARSWIRVFDPGSGTTLRLRELPADARSAALPARFVAYDVDTHQTVGVRFRREDPGAAMRLELGPLGSPISVAATRR